MLSGVVAAFMSRRMLNPRSVSSVATEEIARQKFAP